MSILIFINRILKHIVFNVPFLRKFYEKGCFIKHIRKQRIINFFFQKIFRINSQCKFSVHFTSQVVFPEKLNFGKNVEKSLLLSGGCYFQAGNGIEIGDDTLIAPGVKIISANHNVRSKDREWVAGEPIKIGKNCWIAANAIILPGVEIGDNVVVGAGAVVTKSFSSDVIIAGNPAKIL